MVEKPHLLEVEHRTQKAQSVPTPPHVGAALASSWFIDFILQQKGVRGVGSRQRDAHILLLYLWVLYQCKRKVNFFLFKS